MMQHKASARTLPSTFAALRTFTSRTSVVRSTSVLTMSSTFADHKRAATFTHTLVRACSSKTPGKRYGNVGELVEVLGSVLEREDTDIIEKVITGLLEDTSKLVKPTERIQDFCIDDVRVFFDVDYRLTAATSLLTKFGSFGKRRTRATVLGHKH